MDINKLMDELKLYGCIQQGREVSAEKILRKCLDNAEAAKEAAKEIAVVDSTPVIEEAIPAEVVSESNDVA